MKIDSNGISINCEISGTDGAPWLTMSNSLGADLSMWDNQAALLNRDFRVLRYDTRGHGGSDSPPSPYGFPDLIGDVVGLWDALGIRKSHFVGLSLGGMTALGLALEHADRLLSLAVCDSRADAPAPYRDAWNGRIATALSQGVAPLAAPTMERWFTPATRAAKPDLMARVRDMILRTSPNGYAGCGAAIQTLDYLPHIGAIRLPTLCLVGSEDAGTPPAAMQGIHRAIAGSVYVEIADAGHLSNMEQPAAFNDALSGFLATLKT